MRVWLVTIGEPLALPGETARLWRCGLLARTLVARGHQVTWWSSTFDHIRKRHYARGNREYVVLDGVLLRLLDGIAYRSNIAISRLVNHAQLAWQFRRVAATADRPDLIMVSFPTIELAYVALGLARHYDIPIVVDVRDLWPDIFLDAIPSAFRRVARLVLGPYFRLTRAVMSNSSALTAVSEQYLNWGLSYAGRAAGPMDRVFPLGYERTQPTDQDRASVKSLLGDIDSYLIAVFAGSFGHTYDLATVIEAAGLLERHGASRLQFVLCGTGEREAQWRRMAAGMSNVTFTGLLAAGELAVVLESAKFGLAAYADRAPQGIPNKIIEYLSAGLPVVACLPGEAEQMLAHENCGVSYTPGDARDLARQLAALEYDPERVASLGRNALAVYARCFSAERVYVEMTQYLEELAQGRAFAPLRSSRNMR